MSQHPSFLKNRCLLTQAPTIPPAGNPSPSWPTTASSSDCPPLLELLYLSVPILFQLALDLFKLTLRLILLRRDALSGRLLLLQQGTASTRSCSLSRAHSVAAYPICRARCVARMNSCGLAVGHRAG